MSEEISLNIPELKYKAFKGGYSKEWRGGYYPEIMPEVIRQERIPVGVQIVLEERLNTVGAMPAVRKGWSENLIWTADAVIYLPDDSIKIVKDCSILKNISEKLPYNLDVGPHEQVPEGPLILSEEECESQNGLIVTKKEWKKITKNEDINKCYSRKEIKENPIWIYLAGSEKLLSDHTDMIYDAYIRGDETKKMCPILFNPTSFRENFKPFSIRPIEISPIWIEYQGAGDSYLYFNSDLSSSNVLIIGYKPDTNEKERCSILEGGYFKKIPENEVREE